MKISNSMQVALTIISVMVVASPLQTQMGAVKEYCLAPPAAIETHVLGNWVADKGLKVFKFPLESCTETFITGTPVAGHGITEQINSLLSDMRSLIGAQGNIIHQVIFLRSIRDKNECLRILKAHFNDKIPATTFLQQPPCNGSMLGIEAYAKIPQPNSDLIVTHENRHLTLIKHDELHWGVVSGITSAHSGRSTYEQTQSVFHRLETILSSTRYRLSNAVRFWNYVYKLLQPEENKTRYSWFCDRRVEEFPEIFSERLQFSDYRGETFPAATGIGNGTAGVLVEGIFFDSDRDDVFVLPLDNPFQINPDEYAWAAKREGDTTTSYPKPLFKRGAAMVIGKHVRVDVSGTASIIGRVFMYEDDVEKQTIQTIEIIAKLLEHAQDELAQRGIIVQLGLEQMGILRVYVKNQNEYEKVKKICFEKFGDIPISFVVADVCYPKLRVEIEGVALAEATEVALKVAHQGRVDERVLQLQEEPLVGQSM